MRNQPRIQIIVTATKEGVIGKQGREIWNDHSATRRFKDLTMETPCIMGRITWESYEGRALPRRDNIVLTKNTMHVKTLILPSRTSLVCAPTLEDALAAASNTRAPLISIIGGQSVFEQFLPMAHEVHLTTLTHEIRGDRHFPMAALLAQFQQMGDPWSVTGSFNFTRWHRKI